MTPQRAFTASRVALGLWPGVWFAGLLPNAAAFYSHQGLFPSPDYAWWLVFPSPLRLWDSPLAARAFVGGMLGLSGLLVLGWGRRWVALALWFGLASLYQRNFMVYNLSLSHLGWLLLALALTPKGALPPPLLRRGFWWVMGLSYSVSGLMKLGTPEWLQGRAVGALLASPIQRDNALVDALLGLPEPALGALSYAALAIEVLALPSVLWRRGRWLWWAAAVGMHLVIASTTTLTSLSLGVVVAHLFLWVDRPPSPSPR